MTRIAPALMTLMLAGCFGGGGVCKSQARDLEKECGITTSDADIEACEAGLESCTGKEERQLEKYNKCIQKEGFSMCPADPTTGTTDDFADALSALIACADEIDDISQECLNFGYDSTYSSSSSWSTSTSSY